jgi:hypothetical protein
MIIKLEPTGQFEIFRGVQFRVFTGVTDRGIKVQMLGMFRIPDGNDRVRFEKEIGAIPIDSIGRLLTTEGLIIP